MDNIALILAAGKGTRWKGEKPKQLIDVDGETLIARTQRQVKERGWAFRVVTTNEEIQTASECWFEPSYFDWIVDTMLSTEKLWRGRTCFLFGDVWYSDDFIELILSDVSNFHAYTNRNVMGITFDKDVAKIVSYALISTIEGTKKGFVDGLIWRFLGEFSRMQFITDTKATAFPINTLGDYEVWKELEK